MKTIRKLICHIFGHEYVVLYGYMLKNDYTQLTEITILKCSRCGEVTRKYRIV